MKLLRYTSLIVLGSWGSMGCNEPFSNEDLLYLLALPRALRVDVPEAASGTANLSVRATGTEETPAKFYLDAKKSADEINSGILKSLDFIDAIADQAEASVREEDLRVFGPFVDKGRTTKLIVERIRFVDTGTTVQFTKTSTKATVDALYSFRLCISSQEESLIPLRRGDCGDKESVTLMGGKAIPSSERSAGMGEMYINGEALRILGGKSKPEPLYYLRYDTRNDQVTIELIADLPSALEIPFVSYDAAYLFRGTRARGLLVFAANEDIVRTDATEPRVETLVIGARWIPGGSGRADVAVTGEDVQAILHQPFAGIVECWNGTFERVFLMANYPLDPPLAPFGEMSDCGPQLQHSAFEAD